MKTLFRNIRKNARYIGANILIALPAFLVMVHKIYMTFFHRN